MPPSGGEEDKIPPEIVFTYPQPGTINFDNDYIEIEFSEYVNKRSFQEALFISPYIHEALDYSWTGTTVTVYFPDGFKEEITYTITIGTDLVDLNAGNRMSESFTFSFSTGDKIDRNAVTGKVFGVDKVGVLIFAYKIGYDNDSLFNHKPDYISQTGSDGNYQLKGLGDGDYRIFAVKDEFRDLIFQREQDLIGMPYKDINLNDADSLFAGMDFLLFNADTSKNRLVNSIMTDANHLLVTFTGEVETSMIYSDNFTLFDSTRLLAIIVDFSYKGKTKPEEMVLSIKNILSKENNYFLLIDSVKSKNGSVYLNDFVQVTLNDKPDTLKPKIIETSPSQNSAIDFIDPQLKIFLDDAVVKNNINEAITFEDTLGNKVNFEIEFSDDATIKIKPLFNLKPDKIYKLNFDLSKREDAAGNKGDSLYSFSFKTISGLDFTGVSGKLLNVELSRNPVIVLENVEKADQLHNQTLSSDNFEFKRIEPGKYFLWCYLDKNKNGEYDFGWPEPTEFAEEFSFYPDTLILRPRWEITDIIYRFR